MSEALQRRACRLFPLVLVCPLAGCKGGVSSGEGTAPREDKLEVTSVGASETGARELAPVSAGELARASETDARELTPASADELARASETGDEAPSEAAAKRSLADELVEWAGSAPVLLLASKTALLAGDGTRTRELVTLPIADARYDAGHRIIWFLSGTQLQALDLTVPAGPPIVVLDGFPVEQSLSLPDAGVWFGTERVPEFLSLRWKGAASVEVEATFENIINEDIAKALAAAEIVDAAWLATLAARTPIVVPKPAAAIALRDAPTGECETNPAVCQRGVPWPNTSWVLYVSEYECGDYCYWACGLLDSKTGYTADPAGLPTPTWDRTSAPAAGACGPYPVDAGGAAIVIADELCRGSACTPLPGHALGFMDPGPSIEAGP